METATIDGALVVEQLVKAETTIRAALRAMKETHYATAKAFLLTYETFDERMNYTRRGEGEQVDG